MPPDIIAAFQSRPPDQQKTLLSQMTAEQKQTLYSEIQKRLSARQTVQNVAATVSAAPPEWSPEWAKGKILTARDWLVNQLPAVGGMTGGIIGAASGAETGPGAAATAALGAAAGGGLGEDARQSLDEHFHPEDRKMKADQAAYGMAKQALLQGGNELAGQAGGAILGRAVSPIANKFSIARKYPILRTLLSVADDRSPRAAQHLTAAAATKQNAGVALEAIGNTLDDIQSEMLKLPPGQRTVGGFLKAVNARKDAMNLESGAAMLPIAGQQTVPTGVSSNIRNLVRSYMGNTPGGKTQKQYLINRAAEFSKPWTFRQLDELRTDLASQLARHKAKESVAKYTAEKGDLDLAVDNAILDGLRDTVYPEMDRAAGRPAGYFENLKSRQSSLITLEQLLNKRVKDLTGAQAVSEVAPRFSSENISASLHPGSLPRIGAYGIRQAFAPTRELNQASRHVSRAFPTINALPYQLLISGAFRGAEAKPRKKQEAQ